MATMTKCPECGGKLEERRDVVRAQPLGRTVRYEQVRLACRKCGATYLMDDHARANDAAWTEAFGAALGKLSGDDLKQLRTIAKLSQPELEEILGLGRGTIARWETGQRPMPGYIATLVRVVALHPTALRELARLVRAGFVEKPTTHEDRAIVLREHVRSSEKRVVTAKRKPHASAGKGR